MAYLGVDNGSSGSFTAMNNDGTIIYIEKAPVRKMLKWTKEAQYMSIIVYDDLVELLKKAKKSHKDSNIMAYIERPMINYLRFNASLTAIAAYVVTIMAFEKVKIPYEIVDSKTWQKEMLPAGIQGSPNLKKASVEVAKRLFPNEKININVSDSVLIAEFYRRKNLGLIK